MRMYYENKGTNNPPNFLGSLGNKNIYRKIVNSPIKQVFREFPMYSTPFNPGHVTVIGGGGGYHTHPLGTS